MRAAKNGKQAPILAENNIINSAFHPNRADPTIVKKDANGKEKVTIKRYKRKKIRWAFCVSFCIESFNSLYCINAFS